MNELISCLKLSARSTPTLPLFFLSLLPRHLPGISKQAISDGATPLSKAVNFKFYVREKRITIGGWIVELLH